MEELTDWQRILATKDDENPIPNEYVRCVKRTPELTFALCHLAWQTAGPIDPRTKALLEYNWHLLQGVMETECGTSWFMGAVYDWAMAHRPTYEVWVNGEMC